MLVDPKLLILRALDEACRKRQLSDYLDLRWVDAQTFRLCRLHAERGRPEGWQLLLDYLRATPRLMGGLRPVFEELGWLWYFREDRKWYYSLPDDSIAAQAAFSELWDALKEPARPVNQRPAECSKKRGQIMYLEEKPDLAGHARIGRVQFSATRKTIYYAGRGLQSLKGGYKANYYDVASGLKYWISNCKKRGDDTLYPGVVEIDEDAREEYWLSIRQLPENVALTNFRSEGKYAKRRPR